MTDPISQTIFRAYDIRGLVDHDLSEEGIYLCGLAIGSEILHAKQHECLVGRDGRLSSPRFHNALLKGLLESGCDVIDIGIVPSPVLYFAVHHLGIRSGVMITGSHNPSDYNGLKMIIDGRTLSDEAITKLYHRICQQDFFKGNGRVQQTDVLEAYVDAVVERITLSRPLKVVIDAGNGVAGCVAPTLFKKLGCHVIPLFCDVDGTFPNHHPDPSVPMNCCDCQAAVLAHQADLGLIFDGDGDRLGVVSEIGELIWPDKQMMLLSEAVLKTDPGATIVYDVKCSKHLKSVISHAGGNPIMTKTGHSYIKNTMLELNAALAGEMSGHLFFKDRWFGFDDALYSGARVLEIVASTDKTLSQSLSHYPNSVSTAELSIEVGDEAKFELMTRIKNTARFNGAELIDIDGLRVEFDFGWGLMRASNTSPKIVLRFEADSQAGLDQLQATFREQLLLVDPTLQMPF